MTAAEYCRIHYGPGCPAMSQHYTAPTTQHERVVEIPARKAHAEMMRSLERRRDSGEPLTADEVILLEDVQFPEPYYPQPAWTPADEGYVMGTGGWVYKRSTT